jgi:hypothetical protein
VRRLASIVGILLLVVTCTSGGSTQDPFAATKAALDVRSADIGRAYGTWLQTVGLDRILTVHAVLPGSVLTPPDDPTQTWTVHLLLRGAAESDQTLARAFWSAVREAAAEGGDLEHRLLFRFARDLDVPVAHARVRITRYPSDQCWVITIGVTADEGLRVSEHTCTSATAVGTVNPAVLAPLAKQLWARTHGSRMLTTVPKDAVTVTFDGVEQQLRTRFARGRIQVASEPAVREIVVDRIKNEVLAGTGRWERLTFAVVAVPRADGKVDLVLNVDGQYAPGVGGTPPPKYEKDMEPEHASALQMYTKALVTKLALGTGGTE